MNSRREFLKLTALSGTALILGIGAGKRKAFRPNAWLQIDRDGTVTLTVGKSEMGQGVRTSLPMILADELGADWSRVRIVQASTGPDFKTLNTGGSWSVGGSFTPLRKIGAAAREMLIAAAAARWRIDRATLRTENGFVTDGKRRVAFAELVDAASNVAVPKDPPLRLASEFRIIGRRISRIDGGDIVSGKAKYGIDMRVPGMLFASVARPPVVGGGVTSFDASKAKHIHGVRDVVAISSGVAVVADNSWAAMKGRDALRISFDDGPHAGFDSDRYIESLVAAAQQDGVVMRREGKATNVAGAKTLEATYIYPFYAHAPVEPMNCIAHARAGSCEIWAPTQSPPRVQKLVGRRLGISAENVTVHVTLLGGGFGRRLSADYAVEAAELSRAVGRPVQILWTRPDDMQHGHLQHASVHALRGGIDDEGNVVVWSHKKISNPIMNIDDPPARAEMADLAAFYRDAAWGVPDNPYEIPHMEMSYVRVDSPVRYGPWRAVYAPSSVFARESFIDELARAAGRDPLQLRLDLLRSDEHKRLRRVLEAVRDRSGWNTPLPAGRARGVACNIYDGDTRLAYVAEITMKGARDFTVDRVVCAVDCGPVVNPIGVEQQVEGGVIWALTQLRTQITIRGGRVEQSTFGDYDVPRIADAPAIETHILPAADARPTGMGEPPVPPLVPAVLNAYFAASGNRVRRLPLQSTAVTAKLL